MKVPKIVRPTLIVDKNKAVKNIALEAPNFDINLNHPNTLNISMKF